MPSTLNDKVEVLRSQLGLAADLSLAEVVQKAAEHVGLSDDDMGNPLHSKADACMQKMGVVVPPERIAMGTDGRPIPRIFVTEMVGGHTGVDRPREGSAKPRLIEYPPIAELQAMSTERLQALRFTSIGWKARGGLDALKFWRNDGEESDFYGACPKLNKTTRQFGDLSKSFNKSSIEGDIRGVKVFYDKHNVTGLALLGADRVLAQEGPGDCRDGYGEHVFTFGANEKLVGFQFYTDHCTPKLGCIVADMGTKQEGSAIDPALTLVTTYLYANVEPDACGGIEELWRFSEAARPQSMPVALRANLTTDEYTAVMDGVNAVLDRHGAPQQEACCQFCVSGPTFTDGIGCGLLRLTGCVLLPLIVPAIFWKWISGPRRGGSRRR